MECAQCHDHKYDPISQREYYQMFAYFNNTTDPGMQSRGGNQAPVVNVPPRAQAGKLAELRKAIEARNKEIESYKRAAVPEYAKWLRVAEKSAGNALPEPAGLAHFFPLDGDVQEGTPAGQRFPPGTSLGTIISCPNSFIFKSIPPL